MVELFSATIYSLIPDLIVQLPDSQPHSRIGLVPLWSYQCWAVGQCWLRAAYKLMAISPALEFVIAVLPPLSLLESGDQPLVCKGFSRAIIWTLQISMW